MTATLLQPDLSLGTYRVWQRNRDVVLRLWRSEIVAFLIEPVIALLALGFGLGKFVSLGGNVAYIVFLAPGLLTVFPMFASVFECAFGSFVRLEMQGTYQAIVATPVSVDDVVAGDMSFGMTRSVMNGTWIFIVLVVISHWQPVVTSPLAVLIVPLLLLSGLLFSAISMCYVSVAHSMSQFNYFFNLVINPMFWFGGAFFPFESMPRWAQTVAWFIPTTHIVAIYRGLLSGQLAWSMAGNLAWLLVATAVFFFVALAGMRRRLIQ